MASASTSLGPFKSERSECTNTRHVVQVPIPSQLLLIGILLAFKFSNTLSCSSAAISISVFTIFIDFDNLESLTEKVCKSLFENLNDSKLLSNTIIMKYIAFDLETTGFLPGVEQITEIGAVKFENGKAIARFATLVNPQKPIPAEVVKVTGITDEMVKDAPLIESLLPQFAEFCGEDLIVAHNAAFDVQFLTADIKKYESPAPKGLVLDTLGIAKKVIPGMANYKLGTLVQHFDIQTTDFHRAEEDAGYCGQLFWKLIQKISDGEKLPAIENLISLSGKSLEFPQIERQPKQLGLMDLL